MALKIFRGDSPEQAQVWRLTPGTVQAGDSFYVAIGGRKITLIATTASAADLVARFVVAISDSTIEEFREVTATAESGVLVLTANIAGVPVTVTSGTADGGAWGVVVTVGRSGNAAFAGSPAKQVFKIPKSASSPLTSTFKIKESTSSSTYTSDLAMAASAGTVETALDAFAGSVDYTVTRTEDADAWTYEVTSTGSPIGGVTVNSNGPIVTVIRNGSPSAYGEIQRINFPVASPSGWDGEFVLILDGTVTASLNVTDNASVMQAALSAIGENVLVVKQSETLIDLEWQDTANKTRIVVSASASATIALNVEVTNLPPVPASAATNEQQIVYLTNGPTGGTFTLSFNGQTTGTIAWNAAAATVQTAFVALSTVGSGNAVVSGSAGGPWTVDFQGTLAGANQPLITGNGAGLTGVSTQTFAAVESKKSLGPNHYDDPDNWLPVGVPVTGDDVRFETGNTDCLYGIDQTGVTLASLWVSMRWTGKLGLPRNNANGYVEYRPRELTCGITSVLLGISDGGGSSKIALNTLAVQTSIEIRGSGGSSESGVPAITWRGTHASNSLVMLDGSVGVSSYSDESATLYNIDQRGGELSLFNTAVGNDLRIKPPFHALNCTHNGKLLQST